MNRMYFGFIASVLAIILSANCVFAQNTAQTLPYTESFSSNSGWTYVNAEDLDEATFNSWWIDQGRLFVYYGYGDYTNASYNDDCATSYAYRTIKLGTSDSVRIEFDITVGGERSYDYALVLFAPTSQTYTGSTSCFDPDCLNSSYKLFGPMSNLAAVHKDTTIANPSPNGTYNIVFVWHNDADNFYNPSAIVDNLSITEVNAPAPAIDVNMSKYITLTSDSEAVIDRLNFLASTDSTGVRIVRGSFDTTFIIGTTWSNNAIRVSGISNTTKIYGNISSFYLNDYGNNSLLALNLSHNTSLDSLYCINGQLTNLDVSGLTNLKTLACYVNQLTSLDVSGLTNLQTLACYGNQLTSLDVSGLTNLQTLACYVNQLTSLDVSGLTNLQKLYCDENQLTSLDVSGLTNLKRLDCADNQLTSLDVSGLTNLQMLTCADNQLTSLDVSGLTNLQMLTCEYNQLTSLDVSGLTNLQMLTCEDNQLTSLNVNGCVNLELWDCAKNQLTSLDVNGLTNLQELYCYENQLTSLNVNGCTNLQRLECYENQLTSLNVNGCSALRYIDMENNSFSTQALDLLFCQLPIIATDDTATFFVYGSNDNYATFLLANSSNALDKNWSLYYFDADYNKQKTPATIGTYVCGSEPAGLDMVDSESLTLYPNPAQNEVFIKGIYGEMVKVFDNGGKLVKQEIINERLDISNLASGVYYIQVKGITNKIIKE